MTEQFSSMERDAFHVPYLLDKTPEAVFHGQIDPFRPPQFSP